jgi:hypothetical protein
MPTNASMREYIETIGSRLVGRVFTYDDALHFVLEVDEETGLARVSFRKDGKTAFISMPIGEVALRLSGTLPG